jgi:hypothetical protein
MSGNRIAPAIPTDVQGAEALAKLHNTRRIGNNKGSRWPEIQHQKVRRDVRLDIITA